MVACGRFERQRSSLQVLLKMSVRSVQDGNLLRREDACFELILTYTGGIWLEGVEPEGFTKEYIVMF